MKCRVHQRAIMEILLLSSYQRTSPRWNQSVASWLLIAFAIHGFSCHGLLPPSQSTRNVKTRSTNVDDRDAINTKVLQVQQTDDDLVDWYLREPEADSSSRRAFVIACAVTMGLVGNVSLEQPQAHAASSSSSATTTTTTAPIVDWPAIWKTAGKRALGGGQAGASAAVVQVCALMWLRTSMNYQYRYGGTLSSSLQTLWSEGGIARLYQGLPFALVQGPLTRFGDTAANVGVLAALEALESTRNWPLPLKTAIGSIAAGTWRIVLMPIDASKTALQVEGKDGLAKLWSNPTPSKLYQGALAQAAATAVGHFPWFLTYNAIDAQLPEVSSDNVILQLSRSAVLGFSASCVSDFCSNSLRVIKTTKQTAQLREGDTTKELSYPEVVKLIVETDGVQGLFFRGLQTRLLTNAIQGAVFSILWKFFQSTNH